MKEGGCAPDMATAEKWLNPSELVQYYRTLWQEERKVTVRLSLTIDDLTGRIGSYLDADHLARISERIEDLLSNESPDMPTRVSEQRREIARLYREIKALTTENH